MDGCKCRHLMTDTFNALPSSLWALLNNARWHKDPISKVLWSIALHPRSCYIIYLKSSYVHVLHTFQEISANNQATFLPGCTGCSFFNFTVHQSAVPFPLATFTWCVLGLMSPSFSPFAALLGGGSRLCARADEVAHVVLSEFSEQEGNDSLLFHFALQCHNTETLR